MPGTATTRIHQALQQEIAASVLAPGAALDEAALAKRFRVSRTPVREALLQLSIQGFVRVVPRAGIFVATLESHELAEMLETLAYLEGLCTGLACQRMSATRRKRLASLHRRATRVEATHDAQSYLTLNESFHEQLYQACGNPFLVQQIQLIRLRTQPYRVRHFAEQERMRQSLQEHADIVEAILDADEQTATEVATHHILEGSRTLAHLIHLHPEKLSAPLPAIKRADAGPPCARPALNWVFASAAPPAAAR